MAKDIMAAVAELNSIARSFDASGPKVAAKFDQIIIKTAHDIESNAKQIVPVDTGATRSSIGTDITRNGSGPGYAIEAEVGAQTNYAPYLELGTSRMAPHAFLGPSFDRFVPGMNTALDAAIDPLAGA